MEPSKKRKDEDKESESSKKRVDDPQPAAASSPSLDVTLQLPQSPSSTDRSSASSIQQIPEAKNDTQFKPLRVNAQEIDQQQSESPPETILKAPVYYTRAAARRLPPIPPNQLRANKLIIENVDRRLGFRNTILRQTTTSRVKPPVPHAQQNALGVVPLGPPPPREPRRATPSSPNRPTSSIGPISPISDDTFSESSGSGAKKAPYSPPDLKARFRHLPLPSLSYDVAWEIVKAFVDGIEKVQDDAELKYRILNLQMDLELPPCAGLYQLYQSSDSMDVVINYVMDYFESWEETPEDIAEESRAEGQGPSEVSPEKDVSQSEKMNDSEP